MTNDIPVEVVLHEPLKEEEIIGASFQEQFQVGSQTYIALKRDGAVYLLKVSYKDGQQVLKDIESQAEFDSVNEVFQSR